MKLNTRIYMILLLIITVLCAPAAASAYNAAGTGSYTAVTCIWSGIEKHDGGTFDFSFRHRNQIRDENGIPIGGGHQHRLNGNVINDGAAGTLNVDLTIRGFITGSAIADGQGNILNISNGRITANASSAPNSATVIVKNGGTTNLNGMYAYANNGHLAYSSSGGTINARDSRLRGNIMHDGDNDFHHNVSNSTMTGNVTSNGNGNVIVGMANSTITGDLNNVSGDGALRVNMDSQSHVNGTAMASGDRQIDITGGTITAVGNKNTLETRNGGVINLRDTTASAAGGSLIYSSSGGTINARDSQLRGNITHNGDNDLHHNMSGSNMTGNVTSDGNGNVIVDMTNSTIVGNLNNVSGDGALRVNMDSQSHVNGTAMASGDRQIDITGGSITAVGNKNTLETRNGGVINLTGTMANAAGGSLINSSSGGTINARDSQLRGNITHNGDNDFHHNMSNSAMTGNVTSDGNGNVIVDMANSTIVGNLNNVSGDGALNVNMDSGSSVTGTAKADGNRRVINITGGTITAATGNDTLNAENGGTINLRSTTASADNGALINSSSSGTVSANGSSLYGDATYSGNGTFAINMTGDSYMRANISNVGSAGSLDLTLDTGSGFFGIVSTDNGKATNVSIATDNEKWTVAGDSDLGGGNLDNGGIVTFASLTTEYLTLKTGDLGLNGATGGRFEMLTDIVAQEHDLLQVTGSTNGSYIITAQENDGTAAATGRERFNVVETGDWGGTFALPNDIDLGAWAYSLRQIAYGTGAAWEIYSRGLSNAGSAVVNAVTSTYLLNYAETNTLVQRMGDLRKTPLLSGFWARPHGGKFSVDKIRLGKEFDMKYGGIHLGYDHKIETDLPGELYAGVMLGYGEGDYDFAYGGGGDTTSFTAGLYVSLMMDNQAYADVVFKYIRTESDFHTYDSVGTKVTSKRGQESDGFGVSLEVGRKYDLDNGWYVEPQAQLSYMRMGSDTISMSNGLRVAVDSYTSLLGRLGGRVGYEYGKNNFYATLSWVKEFDGDFDFTANGQPFRDSIGDDWWVYGVGYTAQLNDANSIYIDVERATGGAFDQDWSVRAGWRIEF